MSADLPKPSLRTPIKVALVASLAELACVLFVHSSHRAAVAVVSGQAVPGGAGSASPELVGWLVVAAEMFSVLVLPPIIIAAVFGCILHVVANRPFQRRRAVR